MPRWHCVDILMVLCLFWPIEGASCSLMQLCFFYCEQYNLNSCFTQSCLFEWSFFYFEFLEQSLNELINLEVSK